MKLVFRPNIDWEDECHSHDQLVQHLLGKKNLKQTLIKLELTQTFSLVQLNRNKAQLSQKKATWEATFTRKKSHNLAIYK